MSVRPLASFLRRSDLLWLAAIVLVTVGIRALWVAYVNVDPNDGRLNDSVFYHNVARLVADGDGYQDPWGRGISSQWPPAYPLALAVLYKLFGWHMVLAKGLGIAFAAATVVLTYLLGRRIFDRRAALLGASLLALFPGQIYFSTLVYAEAMFAMIFMLVLLLTLEWTILRSEARWWQVLVIGGLVGAAAMVRVEGVILVPVLLVLWGFTLRPWPAVVRNGVLVSFGVVLALLPWTARNAIVAQEFIPLRSNAVQSLSRALDPEYEGLRPDASDPISLSEGLGRQLTEPWEVLSSSARKLRRFYQHDSDGIRFILNNRAPRNEQPLTADEQSLWRGLADRYYYAVGAAAIVAAAFCLLRRHRVCLVIIVAILGWTLFFSFIFSVPRYHFPLIPGISILAAAFLVSLWDGANTVRKVLFAFASAG